MAKRGQLGSEAFVYALTVVVVGVILVMGYRYLGGSRKIIDKGELLQFQSKLEADAKSVGREYGTFKKIFYPVPRNLNEVCFVDIGKKDQVLSSKLIAYYPLVRDSLISNTSKNLFFIGYADIHSSEIGSFNINHYPYMNCFHSKNNKIEIGLEGLGGGKSKIVADFITKAKIVKEEKTILQSADEIVTIEVHKGAQVNSDEITIEVVEPTIAQAQQGATDLYKFGPVGAVFNPPAELRIKYNPAIIGTECPSQLPFYLTSEDGNEKITLLSKSIDCKNNIAYFDIGRFI